MKKKSVPLFTTLRCLLNIETEQVTMSELLPILVEGIYLTEIWKCVVIVSSLLYSVFAGGQEYFLYCGTADNSIKIIRTGKGG